MIILILITLIYLLLISSFIYGLLKVPRFESRETNELTCFSIIIPFRNEADNLADLVQSLIQINYDPKRFEVLFVDDESTDRSREIIEQYGLNSSLNFSILSNQRRSNSPKKDAIRMAVEKANHPWIMTTDADGILPKEWLKTYDQFIQHHDPAMIIAPVIAKKEDSFIGQFQALDILSLQGITLGSFGIQKPMLANGANLAYRKTHFEAIRPYEQNDTIASGDDIFLLHEMNNLYHKEIFYLKSEAVIVKTKLQSNLSQLVQQRVRWGSKTSATKDKFTQIAAMIVVLMNICFIMALGLLISPYWVTALMIILSKIGIDYVLIQLSANALKEPISILKYMGSAFCYPFFTMFVLLSSITGNYEWKGRTYKK